MALLSYIYCSIWLISFHIKNPIKAPIKTQIVQWKFYKLFLFLKPTANHSVVLQLKKRAFVLLWNWWRQICLLPAEELWKLGGALVMHTARDADSSSDSLMQLGQE